ncbi:hypothetical protein HanRHA438_Chr03g0112451 [Helianthus annuus]|nr:hypothetical protein HanIR_Chr03g0110891 [Helianthus annuus]KAJ0934863.1 hypothetical protein HanRHA438_Chr03g0112451 [Helianthus annuus]
MSPFVYTYVCMCVCMCVCVCWRNVEAGKGKTEATRTQLMLDTLTSLQKKVFRKTILDEMSVSFSVPPNRISIEDPSQESQLLHPRGQWLPRAYVNPARNCLNLNSQRKLSDIAVIWRNEGDDESPVNKMTFEKLRSKVWLVAYALEKLALEKRICDRD